MLPFLPAAKSRHTLAIFFAAASEIWLPSNTVDDPFPPTTHSGFDTDDFGVVVVAKRGTGAGFAGWALGGFATSSTSGATLVAPSTCCIALWPQISSLHTGTRGAEPPMPMTPIICLLMTTGRPPELANMPS